ncbi:MAG TPA: phytoene/squalene synthase family protein [Gemmatimonadaceae bacterium]|nr:phytoene/squalene synthase family protein [Gemmatimonadaceae bacterium]
MRVDPGIERAAAYMAHHSRSFRLASLVLPAPDRERIERVYAWCRFTDNLADAPPSGTSRGDADQALREWLELSQRAYWGEFTNIVVLGTVMREMRDAGAPFALARTLVEGVRSDLTFRPFPSIVELRDYTFSVASVVGLWLCHLFGVREPWMLSRASALGHAMQLSNILRDVGEDLADGRVYLPLDHLATRGLSARDLADYASGRRPIDDPYRSVIESLMQRASDDYALTREAISHLPRPFGRAVAVAASVYEGLHDAIRANGYDNFRYRARVGLGRKLVVGSRAVLTLRRPKPVYFSSTVNRDPFPTSLSSVSR